MSASTKVAIDRSFFRIEIEYDSFFHRVEARAIEAESTNDQIGKTVRIDLDKNNALYRAVLDATDKCIEQARDYYENERLVKFIADHQSDVIFRRKLKRRNRQIHCPVCDTRVQVNTDNDGDEFLHWWEWSDKSESRTNGTHSYELTELVVHCPFKEL